jgi:hypothetical protein
VQFLFRYIDAAESENTERTRSPTAVLYKIKTWHLSERTSESDGRLGGDTRTYRAEDHPLDVPVNVASKWTAGLKGWMT